jgi:hypothetical protein
MASPFSIFRRNQKVLMAGLTIMAMIGFTFLSWFAVGNMGNPAADRTVITTTKYGKLRQAELQVLLRDRHLVFNFLDQAQWQAMLATLPPSIDPAMLEQFHRYQMQQNYAAMRQMFGDTTERAIGDTWLLARRADELKIAVSDAAVAQFIKDYIKASTRGGSLSSADMRNVMQRIRVTELQLMEALRTEIKARRLQQLFLSSVMPMTPGQRWDYFQRLTRQANVQLTAVPVEKFVDKIADPPEAELRKLFEEHKDALPDPNRADPGFREPPRAAIEYFRADLAAFTDPKAVTDEDIKQYYEKHKDTQFLDTSLPSTSPEAETKPGETKSEEKKPAETKPAAEKKPAETKPAQAKSAEKKPADIKPTESKPVEKKPAEKKSGEKKAGEKGSSKANSADKPAAKPASSDKKDSKSSMWSSASVQFVADSQPAKDAKASEPAAAKTDEKAAAEKKATPAKDDKKESSDKPESKPVPKYIPLEKVRDEIRQTIARERAMAKIKEAIRPLQDKMTQYGAAQIRYGVDKKTNPNLAAPEKPDLAAMAKQAGMTSATTGLLDPWEIAKLDIGRTVVSGTNEAFVLYAVRTLRLYHTVTTSDPRTGDVYLVWKNQESKEKTPKFEDPGVVEKVRKAWKLIEARKLAMDEGKRIADEARQSKKLLKDMPKLTVIDPPPFTWMTQGMMAPNSPPPPPVISAVDGVQSPGSEFMQMVFSQPEEGGIGIAMNEPKTVVYVVQALSFKPSAKDLESEFLTADYSRYAQVAMREQRQMAGAWLDEIKTQAGFKWQREPDRREEDTSRAGQDMPASSPSDPTYDF